MVNILDRSISPCRYLPALFLAILLSRVSAQKPELGLPIGHQDEIIHLSFSRDGKYVLTAGLQSMKLWDFQTGKLLRSNDQRGATSYAILSPDANQVFFEDNITDPVLLVWDIEKGTVTKIGFDERYSDTSPAEEKFLQNVPALSGAADFEVWGSVFSSDGNQALVYNGNHDFQYWNVKSKKLLAKGTAPASLFSDALPFEMIYSEPDGFQPYIGFGKEGPLGIMRNGKNTLQVWDLVNGRVLQSMTDTSMFFRTAVLSPDGKSIIATDRKKIQHWDRESGRLMRTYPADAVNFAETAPHPTAAGIFVGMASGVRYWDFEAGGITGAWPGATQVGKDNKPGQFQAKSPAYTRIWQDGKIQQKNLPVLSRTITAPDRYIVSPDMKKAVFQRRVYQEDFSQPPADSLWIWDLEQDRQQLFLKRNYTYISPDLRYGILKAGDQSGLSELWNLETGQRLNAQLYAFAAFGDNTQTFAVSADGKFLLFCQVEFYTRTRTISVYDLETGQLYGKFQLDGQGLHPVFTFSPDNKFVLMGSGDKEEPILLVDTRTGQVVQRFTGQKGGIAGQAFSADSRYAFTAASDYTLRIWDTATGREKAALIALGDRDWVATAPNGLFDASSNAMSEMYYTVGREVIELEQLKERYFEPGLLSKVMGLSDEPLRSVEGFDSVALYPAVRLALDTLHNKLKINLTPRNGGVGKVSVFVNGKEIVEEANPPKGFDKKRDTDMSIDLEQYARYFLTDSINTISIRAYNEAGWLKSAAQNVEFRSVPIGARGQVRGAGMAPFRKNRRPALYILSVGTADYAGAQLDLKYSGKDAKDMAAALRQIGAQLFTPDSVFVQLLTSDTSDAALQPSKANIKAAFDAIKAHAKAEDVLVAYFSGHGIAYGDADRALFYYLTKDIGSFDLSDAGVRAQRTVSSNELTRWINDIPAQKQVLIIDACNSGKVVENLAGGQKALSASQIRALDRMKDRTGMFVLTGSTADKVSYEAGQYGQGLLTYSLLQGMKGAALSSDKRVDVMALFQSARDVVPVLAKGIGGIQTPMMATPLGGGSFDIGIANNNVNIPLAAVKPVFIRNIFLDENNFNDVLGLTKALSEYFEEQTAKGAQATIVYVDVNEYEDAYSMKGLYTVKGNNVEVRGRLFKGEAVVGSFQVKGDKNDLPHLVSAMVDKVSAMVQ